MAVTGLALTLIGIYAHDIRATHTIRELSLTAKKAYANVHATTTQLINYGILTKTTIGHSHACTLNVHNERALLYLAFAIEEQRIARYAKYPRLAKIEENNIIAYEHGQEIVIVGDAAHTVKGARTITRDAFIASGTWRRAGAHLITGTLAYIAIVREATR